MAGASEHADLEQFGLARDDVADVGLVGAIGERRRKLDLVEPALLGLEPRRARPAQPVLLLGQHPGPAA